jgi:hypothetical protein
MIETQYSQVHPVLHVDLVYIILYTCTNVNTHKHIVPLAIAFTNSHFWRKLRNLQNRNSAAIRAMDIGSRISEYCTVLRTTGRQLPQEAACCLARWRGLARPPSHPHAPAGGRAAALQL